MTKDSTANELKALKKENQRLKVLLKNAVEILEKYRDILRHPEKLGVKPGAKAKPGKATARKQASMKNKPQ